MHKRRLLCSMPPGDKRMMDSGCKFYHDCESCPFPDCLVDNIPSLLVATRRAEARELAKEGMPKAQIAKKLGVSRMQVYRYLGETVT